MTTEKNRILMLLENNSYPGDSRVKKEANSLTDAGYQVTVVCPTSPGLSKYEMIDGVRVYRYRVPPEVDNFLGYVVEYGYAFIMGLIYTFYIAFRHGFDCIHSHNPPEIYVFIAMLFKPFGKKFVFDHHDLSPEVYNARSEEGGSKTVTKVLLWMERVTFRFADHVISTNQSYKEVAMTRGGVDPDNISIVRNGPNLNRFRPVDPDPEIRAKADFIFGYAGDMEPQDGIDYLVRSLAILKNELGRDDFFCVLMGDGGQRKPLTQLAQELGLENHLEFTGYKFGEDFIRALAAADICLDPDPSNPFNDKSTMIKIPEYMSMEKPIVAFDLPEHRRSAEDAAVYVADNDEREFAKAILDLMNDPERRETMGKYGRKRVLELLAWEYSAKNLVNAYHQVLPLKNKNKQEKISYA